MNNVTYSVSLKDTGCSLKKFGNYIYYNVSLHRHKYTETIMKKLLLLLLALAGVFASQTISATQPDNEGGDEGYTFPYITFVTTDGVKTSVPVSELKMTISGNTLTAGSQSFTLSNLSKMYFSTINESATGIEAISATTIDESSEIYDLSGRKLSKGQVRKGCVYLVKTNNKTFKMIVR